MSGQDLFMIDIKNVALQSAQNWRWRTTGIISKCCYKTVDLRSL
ncbi:hypothetical protein SLEP1_g38436 [Rubroshorea leprosula]|nr:hypothetical protein SLEP1_g38436 [Rubroshorea leprosula]